MEHEGRIYRYVDRQILVQPKRGIPRYQLSGLVSSFGATVKDDRMLEDCGFMVVEFPQTVDLFQARDIVRNDPSIEHAQLDYVGTFSTYFDPLYSQQWALRKIKAPEGWAKYTTGDSSIVVAILDSGFTEGHPELDRNKSPDRIILGMDYTGVGWNDRQDHSMGVAGIVAAEANNGHGIAGITWKSKLLFIKVGKWTEDGGEVRTSWLAAGINYVVDQSIANPNNRYIINCSVGIMPAPEDMPVLAGKVALADSHNVLIVAAAGNTVEFDGKDDLCVNYPALWARKSTAEHYCNVMSVGAVDSNYYWANYSNYLGPDSCEVYIDIAAPGGCSYTDPDPYKKIVTLTVHPDSLKEGTYYKYSYGTSYAAAHVSGVAALVWALNPYLSHYELKDILKQTAWDPSDPAEWSYGTIATWCYDPVNPYKSLDLICEDGCNRFDYNRKKGTGIVNADSALYVVRRPYIHGEITTNMTLSGEVFVVGDLTVTEGKTLTIEPGSELRISGGDLEGSGEDSSRVEITAYGAIVANGTQNDPITFVPEREDPQPGCWTGIRITGDNSSASFSYCTVTHAYHGIRSCKPVTVSHCTVTDCQVHGLYYEGYDASGAVVRHSSFTDNVSAGIAVSYCDNVAIDTCTANGNYYGVWTNYADNTAVTKTDMKYNDADGIRVLNSDVDIEWCMIEDNDQHGASYIGCPGSIKNTKIWKNTAYGVYCTGSGADPIIGHSKIEQNTVGVMVASGAGPCLGLLMMGGQNAIYDQTYYVYTSPTNNIYAENNWWGTAQGESPNPAKFKGSVDFVPYLQSDPVVYLYRRPESALISQLGQCYPNPYDGTGSTTIRYMVARSGERVAIRIYDVSGRRVRTLVDRAHRQGRHAVTWDGRNEQGRGVSSGIYFYRMMAGSKTLARKIILFR